MMEKIKWIDKMSELKGMPNKAVEQVTILATVDKKNANSIGHVLRKTYNTYKTYTG